jgi:hypothetical protein
MLIFPIGQSPLLEALHGSLCEQNPLCRWPEARRAYAQLEALKPKMREGGTVYKCLSARHGDLGISCATLNWPAHHPHPNY